ncbi:hypothetical protein VTI74DRAFT_5167 [Chaetomium olivicolor]
MLGSSGGGSRGCGVDDWLRQLLAESRCTSVLLLLSCYLWCSIIYLEVPFLFFSSTGSTRAPGCEDTEEARRKARAVSRNGLRPRGPGKTKGNETGGGISSQYAIGQGWVHTGIPGSLVRGGDTGRETGMLLLFNPTTRLRRQNPKSRSQRHLERQETLSGKQ